MATTKKAAPKEGAKKTAAKTKDAPRIKRKDLDVKPIAPVEGKVDAFQGDEADQSKSDDDSDVDEVREKIERETAKRAVLEFAARKVDEIFSHLDPDQQEMIQRYVMAKQIAPLGTDYKPGFLVESYVDGPLIDETKNANRAFDKPEYEEAFRSLMTQAIAGTLPPAEPIEEEADAFQGDGCDQSRPEVQNFAWAAQQVQRGLRVKREAWIGNKYLEASGAPRNVLTNEDMLATDWIIA